ncbi:hypothetical protein AAC387_Pa03g1448 [Persea americana]
MRFELLKQRDSEAVRSSEPLFARENPSQNLYHSSQPLPSLEPSCSRAVRSSEPLTEPWSLEPPPFFARPFLNRSSPLERPQLCANPFQGLVRLNHSICSLDPS